MKYINVYDTPIGRLCIAQEEDFITELGFLKSGDGAGENQQIIIKETPLLKQANKELLEYMNGKRKKFEVPLRPWGTVFQKAVWNALLEIPYGETRSYRDIAQRVERPKGFQAVGQANNRNPIMIMIPCHRVIGIKGDLVGYGGGLDVKKILLNLELQYKGL